MKQQLVCVNCGYIGYPKLKVKGSTAITIVLLLCYLLPGIIYWLWRRSSGQSICPTCGGQNLVPISSPTGIKMLEAQGKTVASVEEQERQKVVPLMNQDFGQAVQSIFSSLKKPKS